MNLTDYVMQVSMEDFGKPFLHQAQWNQRLRTTGGRFFPKDGHLDFNRKLYDAYGVEVFRKIVRHELCHYHLYFEGKGYRHQDADFKHLLKEVDGLRYAPALPQTNKKAQTILFYQCQKCGQDYVRRRRIRLEKFCCGRCKGRLIFIQKRKLE